jgi:multimeric flavodoxin WrbA
MKYTGAYTAFMYDLLSDKERERLIKFADDVFTTAGSSSVTSRTFSSLVGSSFKYKPGKPDSKISTEGKRILIITDNDGEQTNLSAMTERFTEAFADNIEVVNLRNIDIRGGCLGCLNCCYDYTCVYKAQDGYIEFLNTKVNPADALVFAGAIKDRYLSSLMKCYFDRTFFKGMTPTMKGKQFGFIISGPLRQISNLRQILEAFFEVQQANVVDIITDEAEDSDAIDKGLQSMAVRLIRLARAEYVKPGTFFRQGVGKILRDETWGNQRFVHPADHRYYKKHGLYNSFPQKQYKTRFRNFMMMTLMKIPAFRKELYKRLKAEMVKPLKKVVETK